MVEMKRTTEYYDKHGDAFFNRTVGVDVSELYEPFLSRLAPGARILDAGCGSGRDMKAFAGRGYRVMGLDASLRMVQLARDFTGQDVLHVDLGSVAFDSVFDGIWACASMLHVPETWQQHVYVRLKHALRTGGWWYVSYRYGRGEREHEGRLFVDMDEAGLEELVAPLRGLKIETTWITEDNRPDNDTLWLNALLRKYDPSAADEESA